MAYLDSIGLNTLWAKIKSVFVQTDSDAELNSLTIGGHSSAIGTIITGDALSKSIASGDWANSDSVLTLDAGTWLLLGHVDFPSYAPSGRQGIRLYDTTTSATFIASAVLLPATSTSTTTGVRSLLTTVVAAFEQSNNVCVQIFQNSGSARTVTTRLRAVRIA